MAGAVLVTNSKKSWEILENPGKSRQFKEIVGNSRKSWKFLKNPRKFLENSRKS